MVQLFKCLLFTFICFHFGCLQGEDDCLLISLEEIEAFSLKNYVQAEQVYLSGDQIFVQTEKGLLPVNSLMTDALGFYYGTNKPQNNDKWTCPACRNENERASEYGCGTCEFPSNYNLDLQCNSKNAKKAKSPKHKEEKPREEKLREEKPQKYRDDGSDDRPEYEKRYDPDNRDRPSFWDDEDFYGDSLFKY